LLLLSVLVYERACCLVTPASPSVFEKTLASALLVANSVDANPRCSTDCANGSCNSVFWFTTVRNGWMTPASASVFAQTLASVLLRVVLSVRHTPQIQTSFWA